MNCTNCGAALTGVENVCPNCGNPIIKDVNTNPVEAVPTAPVMDAPVAPVEVAPTPIVDAPVAPVVEPTAPVVDPAPVMDAPVAPVVEPTIPTVEPTPVMETPVAPVVEPTVPVVDPAPVVAPTQPVMEPTPVVNPAQPVPQAPTGFVEPALVGQQPAAPVPEEPKKKDNKTIFLIIALVVVAVAAVVVYFTVLAPANEPESPTPVDNGNSGSQVSTNTEKKESYAGYSFTIPDGYTTKTDSDYGLMIGNSNRMFSIAVDYSHKYEDYKTALVAKYPDQADKLVATVDGREYLILVLTDTDGNKGSEYITKASDSSTFIGMMVRSDYTQATTDDFSVVTEVIDSATKGTTSFAAGDDVDAGKSGEKIYTFTKDKFSFAQKEE